MRFDAPSSRKRIETSRHQPLTMPAFQDLMPLPAEKGLKLFCCEVVASYNNDLMPLPAEKGLKLGLMGISTLAHRDLMPLPAEKGLKPLTVSAARIM